MRLGGFVIHGNNKETLAACLESLASVCDELVAVDSGSNDGSADIVRSFGVSALSLPWQGFGAARVVARDALLHCDYLLFLDSDEWLLDDTRERIRAWKASAATLPYYTLKRRDWAVFPGHRFLYRQETRKRLVRIDHACWARAMIVHESLPPGDKAPLGGFIEHRFARSIEEVTAKQEKYALLHALRLFAEGRHARSTLGLRAAHVARDAFLKGAWFRGGRDAWALARAVSRTHARKYEIMAELDRGEHANLVELYRRGELRALFASL
jgi:glycosyltransferase involved in cell wall biosynthesis